MCKFSQLKEALIQNTEKEILQKIYFVNEQIASLKNSLNSESKSSAGDKHETGRAMIHLEQEKLSRQLADLNAVNNSFKNIRFLAEQERSGLGSLVNTNLGCFFITVSLGQRLIDNIQVVIISPESPIGLLLLNRKTGDVFSFNQKNYLIQGIY